MFGIWRTLLAIEVVAHHLLKVPVIGFYAVFSFFVLSGFLMTAIMHGTYGYSATGFPRYLGNRALRLFPSYWFAVIVSLVTIATFGADAVRLFNPAITMPQTRGAWIENLTMIFWNWLPKDVTPRLVPLAWALTVEISYYLLIGLGFSRTRLTTCAWVCLSLMYVVVIRRLHPEGGGYLYDAVPAGSLPFSVGALGWHYRDMINRALDRLRLSDPRLFIVGRWLLYLAIVATQAQTGWKWLVIFGNWMNIVLSMLIVCTLFTVPRQHRLARWDRVLGSFSYPIYLLHIQMGAVAAMILFGQPVRSGASVFALGLTLTVLLGGICAFGIDPAIEQVRARVRRV